MQTSFGSATARLVEAVIHFFSPNGLLTAVILIVLSVVLVNGSDIEQRTIDNSSTEVHRTDFSPILSSNR